jgi:hypothetical protein
MFDASASSPRARKRASGGSSRVAQVYDWFTEEFDTRDLKEGKVLLEELS